MKFEAYLEYFESIIKSPADYPVYNDEEYLNYTKLNWSRMSRWMKRFVPLDDVKTKLNSIREKQTWIVITEPWCGDAAHSVPQLYRLIENNPNIEFDIQLRDSKDSLIDQYLTNGGKSIPKLIIRDERGNDIAVWGPRPEKLQALFLQMQADDAEFSDIKETMQKWYNEDKGAELQQELVSLLS